MYDDRVQQQSGKALLLLGGHFSYAGESLMGNLLLQKAGFQEFCLEDLFLTRKLLFMSQFTRYALVKRIIFCCSQLFFVV